LLSEYVRYYHEDRTHLGLRKGTPGYRIRSTPRGASFLRIDWAGCIIVTIGLPDPDELFTHPYICISRMCPGPRPKRAFALLKAALD
jgi:hypothetical protein